MSFGGYIKKITPGSGDAGDLSERDSHRLFGAMLDGGVPDLELGAILLALRAKPQTLPELLGFHSALGERLFRLRVPESGYKPVILPSYGGARERPNLLPLLALLLHRFGVPVLMHGMLTGNGRVASVYILRELGIMPCANLSQAQDALDNDGIAFVPTVLLAPGFAELLSLRARLGVRSSAHSIAKLIDPFAGEGLRVVGASHPPHLAKLRELLLATAGHALLLQSTEGEPFANPERRPVLEYFSDGTSQLLFDAEIGPLKRLPTPPAGIDAVATAAWIRHALAGEASVPLPLINQLACCLFGAGYTSDMNQAKAIVAVETGSLAAA